MTSASQRLEESRQQTIQNKKKTQYCRGAMGTSTLAVACASASQPQLLLCAHPSELSLGHKNLPIDSGDDLFCNNLVLNSSALLFWSSSEGLPSSSPLSNMMVSPFLPSPSSPRSPFQWTCDKSWDKRNTTPLRVPCLDSCHKRLASIEQHGPRRGDDGVGHKNDGLPGLRLRRELLLHHNPALPEVRLDRRRHSVATSSFSFSWTSGAWSVFRSSSSAFRSVCLCRLKNGPFLSFFRSEWAPLVGLGVRNVDAGAKFGAPFLVWASHFGGQKTSKCEQSKNHMKHTVDRPKMHVV